MNEFAYNLVLFVHIYLLALTYHTLICAPRKLKNLTLQNMI